MSRKTGAATIRGISVCGLWAEVHCDYPDFDETNDPFLLQVKLDELRKIDYSQKRRKK
jgi:hypothetical protein